MPFLSDPRRPLRLHLPPLSPTVSGHLVLKSQEPRHCSTISAFPDFTPWLTESPLLCPLPENSYSSLQVHLKCLLLPGGSSWTPMMLSSPSNSSALSPLKDHWSFLELGFPDHSIYHLCYRHFFLIVFPTKLLCTCWNPSSKDILKIFVELNLPFSKK